jgi:hypothetical protein
VIILITVKHQKFLFLGEQMSNNRIVKTIGMCLGIVLFSSVLYASESGSKRVKKAQEDVKINITPWGYSQETLDKSRVQAERSKEVQSQLSGTRYRFIELTYIENEDKSKGNSQVPTRYRAVFYDYTNERTLVAEGNFDGTGQIVTHEENYQPTPNDEEFEEAVRVIQNDSAFSGLIKNQSLKTFRPMPDVTVLDGTNERLINVGISSNDSSASNEVVSVSIKNNKLFRYEEKAPPTSKAAPDACGVPDAGQPTTARNTAGQYQMTVTQGATTLWEMLIIRPSVSSGTRASGVEVRDVKYRGKSVMKRGHAPVLNVEYVGGQCGPYRDWQYQEDQFATPATGNTDPAPGIRIVASGQVATTALETGVDSGNFRGVAVYTLNGETVLVTELQAGWYRYIMEWRFDNNGTIRPRFGFGATDNSCVCFVHNHHVYWRFDMDVVNPNNNVYLVERGRKFQKPLLTETAKLKSSQLNRSLLIQNSTGDEAYRFVPNMTDGIADTYGRGDMWVLKYKGVVGGTALQNELDDGYNSVGGSGSAINMVPFLNNESIEGQDVVVWYGAHFVHSDGSNLLDPSRNGNQLLSGSHVVGPDLRPVRW